MNICTDEHLQYIHVFKVLLARVFLESSFLGIPASYIYDEIKLIYLGDHANILHQNGFSESKFLH